MAIAIPGAPIQAIAGQLGGLCFKNSRGTTVVGTASAPSDSPSQSQMAIRCKNSHIWTAWIAEDSQTRNQWEYAGLTCPYRDRFGVRQVYSGWECYHLMHAVAWELEPYQTIGPPVPGIARAADTVSFTPDDSPWYSVTWTAYTGGVPLYVLIHGQPQWSVARLPAPRSWRRLYSDSYKFPGVEVADPWIERFGPLQVGQPAWVRVRWYSPGSWPSQWRLASARCIPSP